MPGLQGGSNPPACDFPAMSLSQHARDLALGRQRGSAKQSLSVEVCVAGWGNLPSVPSVRS